LQDAWGRWLIAQHRPERNQQGAERFRSGDGSSFLLFRRLPVPVGFLRGARPFRPKHMGMSAHHFLVRLFEHRLERKPALPLCENRKKQHGIEYIA